MPSCSTATNPKGIKITFTEDDHKYTSVIDGKDVVYTSGTTFVGKFFPVFDPDGRIAERCAKKEGVTADVIKKRWRAKADRSCVFGTKIHAICENIIKGREYELLCDNEYNSRVSSVAERVANTMKNKIEVIDAEKIVFDHELSTPIAGTIDLLGKSKTDGSILILDWKTNEKIVTDNKYKKYGLGVLANVPDNNYYHYALQLSLYQYILLSAGYYPEGTKFKRAIIHLKDDGSHVYNLPDMTEYIKGMIKTFRS